MEFRSGRSILVWWNCKRNYMCALQPLLKHAMRCLISIMLVKFLNRTELDAVLHMCVCAGRAQYQCVYS